MAIFRETRHIGGIAVEDSKRLVAYQNVDPEYVKIVGEVSEKQKEIDEKNDNVYFIAKDGKTKLYMVHEYF